MFDVHRLAFSKRDAPSNSNYIEVFSDMAQKILENNVNKITQSKNHLLKDNKQNIAENQHVSSKFYVWIKVLFLTLAHSAANPLK